MNMVGFSGVNVKRVFKILKRSRQLNNLSLVVALPDDTYLEYHPFRQLVVADRASVQELEIPGFIQSLGPGGGE
jgi:hypothetical protein